MTNKNESEFSPEFTPQVSTILDNYSVENMEQFEILSDSIRCQIIGMLIEKPMTGAQIARKLQIDRHRIYYHLNLLEEHGLIKFQGERRVKGVIEKYYRAVARHYLTDQPKKKT